MAALGVVVGMMGCGELAELAAEHLPGPMQPDLTAGPFRPGQPATLSSTGWDAGDDVFVIVSVTGEGSGPCPGILGGACLDVVPPLILLATVTADGAGVVTATIDVPPGTDGQAVAFQLVHADGGDSVVSDAVTVTVNADQDGDGVRFDAGDCDDDDPTRSPNLPEVCGGGDEDCDGLVDDDDPDVSQGQSTFYADLDNDGYGDGAPILACTAPPDTSTMDGDCDDARTDVNPGHPELCDGVDNDCNAQIDEGYDVDNDGYRVCDNDCNDSWDRVNPGQHERCDGVDNNCDGSVDEACGENLVDLVDGFAEGTTGGLGGTVCHVTNDNDSGSGSMRSCVVVPNSYVVFDGDFDITLNSDIDLASDLTIDGRGRYVRIFGSGFDIRNGAHNIIINNLIFKEGNGGGDNDAIAIKDSAHDVFVHHVSFSDYGDGALDVTKEATDVTVSWCKFSVHDKVMLIGHDNGRPQDEVIRVTVHHTWFRETTQRHPRARYARVHAYNNYFDAWGSYGMACSNSSSCRVENNVFEADGDEDAVLTIFGSDPASGDVRADGNWLLNGADIDERNRSSVFDPEDHYSYTLETANAGLRDDIIAGAGWQ